MKVKKEYLLLGAAVIGLICYLVFRQTDRTHYRLPELSEIPNGRISRIQIDRAAGAVDIVKKDDKWVIGKENYPADAEAVRGMLDLIGSLTVTALVSESENYTRYQLDAGVDAGGKITVRAWADSALDREFDIGKPASTYQHTFIRLAGDPNVYHARGDLRARFEKTMEELRDRTVLSFALSEIEEAAFSRGKDTRIVCRKEEAKGEPGDAESSPEKGKETPKWLTPAGDPVNPDRINRLLADLSDLECEGFVQDSKKEELKDPIFFIALKGKKEYTLNVYSKENGAKAFPAVSSESPYVFTLPDSRVESLEKIFDEILKSETVK